MPDLHVAVGNGNLGPRDVVHAAYPELRIAARAPRGCCPAWAARGRPRGPPAGESGVALRGIIAGMNVHYAGCCRPLPGDRIVGIVSTGKGVTVHTSGCQTLESFAATPERFLDIEWDYEALGAGRASRRAPYSGA